MKPGDLVFCHGTSFVAKAIRLVQSWRSPKADARWNHVAILYEENDGDWTIIQAGGHGVQIAYLSNATDTYEVVACPAGLNAVKVVEFAKSQVGVKYGFLTIASIVFNVITPQRLALRKPGTWICSALAAGSLWYAGWPTSQIWYDLYQVTPADLYGRTTKA